jgi:FlaA1/EpsC-like NDP-sugar epimerase
MSLNRALVSLLRLAADALLLGLAYCLAFLIRFEGSIPPNMAAALWDSLLYVILIKAAFLVGWHVPFLTWRFVSLLEARRLVTALTAASAMLGALALLCRFPGAHQDVSEPGRLPLSLLVIDLLLSLFSALGLRVVARSWLERAKSRKAKVARAARVPTVLIGAGYTGALVAKELAARPHLGVQPVGFLDDDPRKLGEIIHGLRVLGTTNDLKDVARQHGARQALISINRPSGRDVRRIVDLCSRCGITTKVIAGIPDMVEGDICLSAIRDVAIEDLLHREPVRLDTDAIAGIVASRKVLVTGAGGSIGSELCRVVCRFNPRVLVLVEQAESNLFQVHRELTHAFPGTQVVPYIADICDQGRLKAIFDATRPNVVFHAAAHKHVPMMEWNSGEAVKNNILGTKGLADVAAASGVDQFVMISTDKAVNPTSVMGASKRVAEMCIQALAQRTDTRFITVRFGNVLGSSGSVIPIFKEQIAGGGPVTVTHPDMRRYFMTIPEACQLVLQAASMGKGGEIFILDMGEPVRIVDLARDLIRLSGLSPEDVEIKFTGLRQGEKLFEELLLEEEVVQKTSHSKIFIGRLATHDWEEVSRHLNQLRKLADGSDARAIIAKLREVVPEYTPDLSFCSEPVNGAPEPAPEQGAPQGLKGRHAPVPELLDGFGINLATG